MPIYSYKCNKCEKEIEEYRKMETRLIENSCACGGSYVFQLTFSKKMDGHYPFIDTMMDHNPVEITSLSHYRRELKKRGLSEKGKKRGNPGQWV